MSAEKQNEQLQLDQEADTAEMQVLPQGGAEGTVGGEEVSELPEQPSQQAPESDHQAQRPGFFKRLMHGEGPQPMLEPTNTGRAAGPAPRNETLEESIIRTGLNPDINRFRTNGRLQSDGSEQLDSRQVRARNQEKADEEAAAKQQAEDARKAIEEATATSKPEAAEPTPTPVTEEEPVNTGVPKWPAVTTMGAHPPKPAEKTPEAPETTESTASPEPEAVVAPAPIAPAIPQGRRGRRGAPAAPAAPQPAPTQAPKAPEASTPEPEEEPIPINTATLDEVKSGNPIDEAIANYDRSRQAPEVDPMARPDTSGPIQSYRVKFSGPQSTSSRVGNAPVAPVPDSAAPEATSAAAPEAPKPEVPDHFAHLFRPVTPDTDAENNSTTPDTPEQPARGGRHRSESPASLIDRLLGRTSGTTSPSENGNEATQQIPVVTSGEAATTANTNEAEPDQSTQPERRGFRQRVRDRVGTLATGAATRVRQRGDTNGIAVGEARPVRFATDEERNRPANYRRRLVGALGLAAASAGILSGISGELSSNEAPRAPISANQLPGQQQEGNTSSIAERAKEAVAEARERAREAAKQENREANPGKTIRGDHENITVGKDGSVTVELRQGGNYWEGIHEAEQALDIDASPTATAEAVNTIGFDQGEDRKQNVGSKITFKNVNGKLVAVRS